MPPVGADTRVAVVLAGGIGSRLWPLSNGEEPKQLARALASPSLLQRTVARLRRCASLPGHDTPMLVVCGAAHAQLTSEQLDEAAPGQWELLLEPVRRNTAPALTAAALWAARRYGDPIMIVSPADHHIDDEPALQASIAQSCRLASAGKAVSLGVDPRHPETGYGYIEIGESADEHGARVMRAFREKPDRATAAGYVEDGRHFWNTGILILRASLWLSLVGQYEPAILAACEAALPSLPKESVRHALDARAFGASPTRSIDHGVMERLPARMPHLPVVVPLRSAWSDLGSWDALWRVAGHDGRGNASRGEVALRDVEDSLVYAHTRQVVCLGLKDIVVVETAQAVLVAERGRAQELGQFAQGEAVAERAGDTQGGAVRPWGRYEVLSESTGYRVKRLFVEPGHSLSLQRHRHRSEHWMVLRGQAQVTLDGRIFTLAPGGSVSIPEGALHRLANAGSACLEVLETQLGDHCDERDIERVADRYGRA
ncbi:mannose-1-phosphate guanylyltransferase/mannose-6-phosphate isomerase [Bordetella genomosp. 11]|nr:mannose-1-phosphate guanylyltransferase/mannose-6-phosphate isomerase [Bordetella genomosp. 11]